MEIRSQHAQRIYSALVAIVCWIALLLQLHLSIHQSTANGGDALHGVWMYFAFFTVLTNLLVALVLSMPLISPKSAVGKFCARPDTIAGVAVNIVLVCITYNLLLRHTWNPQGLQRLVDELLHDVVPLLFVVYAWLSARSVRVDLAPRLRWAVWPVLYFVYALLRGAASGFYPHPFIDVVKLGYVRVFGNALGILAGFIVVAAMLAVADRVGQRTSIQRE